MKKTVIINIGGNEKERVGYCPKTQKFFIKDNSNAIRYIVLASITGIAWAGAQEADSFFKMFYPSQDKLLWLLLESLILVGFVLIIASLTLYFSERYFNQLKFKELSDLSTDNYRHIKNISEEKGAFAFLATLLILSAVGTMSIGIACITNPAEILWEFYLITSFLTTLTACTCWHMKRASKIRDRAFKQIEEKFQMEQK